MKSINGNRALIIVAVLIIVSVKIALLTHVLSSGTIGPQALNDALVYRLNAESIFHQTRYYSDHYPPLYPLLLSFAFFSADNWYQWMLYINAVISSLVLVPVWLISRKFLSGAASLSVLLISSLSTFHFFYPVLIMSENLHVPVFAFSLYLLLDSGKGTRLRRLTISALLGVTMAFGYMTKFIYLVAIPVIAILWLIKPLFNDDMDGRRVAGSSRILNLLLMAAGFMVVFLPWYVYKFHWGFGVGGGLGAEFVLKGIPEFSDLENLARWTGFYLSYSLLALAPFLLVLVFYIFMLSSGSVKNSRQETFFILAVVLLSAVFFMTAVQHSWRAGYNYPVPKRINGRYLMHLLPFWVIVFMMALEKVKNVLTKANLIQIMYSCIFSCALLFFPLVLLKLSDNAPWSYDFIDTTDGLFYRSGSSFIFFVAVFLTMAIILSFSKRNRFFAGHFSLLFCSLAIGVQASSALTASGQMLSHRLEYQLHGRALSPFMEEEVRKTHRKIVIITDQEELLGKSGVRVGQSLQFWVSKSGSVPSIKFISLDEYSSQDRSRDCKFYCITTRAADSPVYTYNIRGKTYYVFDIDVLPYKMPNVLPKGPLESGGLKSHLSGVN